MAGTQQEWKHSRDRVGGWYWHHTEMPNGWSPSVSDWSQSIAPAQATSYQVSAVAFDRIVQGGKFPTLEQAKREAILLAMKQEASRGPLGGTGEKFSVTKREKDT